MRVIMPAIINQAGRKFNADKMDGISRRHTASDSPLARQASTTTRASASRQYRRPTTAAMSTSLAIRASSPARPRTERASRKVVPRENMGRAEAYPGRRGARAWGQVGLVHGDHMVEALPVRPPVPRPCSLLSASTRAIRQSDFPFAACPFKRSVFGNSPSPQILNDPKSLYHGP